MPYIATIDLMAIELPSEVAQLLNFIGIPWIDVNEDKVREFATHVRSFAQDLKGTHGDATATLQSMGEGWSGAAYEALMNMWGSKFTSHIGEIVECCDVLAEALDVGAEFIEGQKIFCIGELAVMAAEFVADQAASVATLGIAEAALPVIEEATTKLMEFAEQQIEQYVIGQIANAALQPLMDKLESTAEKLLFGGGGASGAVGEGFSMDHAHIIAHAQQMQGHADTIRGHGATFASNVQALDFSS